MKSIRKAAVGAFVGLAAVSCSGAAGGSGAGGDCVTPEVPTVTLAAYSTPREAYGKIIPAFQEKWAAERDDQKVIFQESYGSSGTQAENMVAGFEADIAALSLAPDLDVVADAGLIDEDWTDQPDGGMVSTSVVSFAVRPGNPEGISNYDDLARPGIEVLTPDPASSGGARWNVISAYGAALRGHAGVEKGDQSEAQELLTGIFENVTVMDKSARDSIKNYEAGNGDVAITYENEVLTGQDAGQDYELVIPESTVLIENPAAVVDQNAEKHCVTEVAEAFVQFLHTDEAKEIFASVGNLRPTDLREAKRGDGDKFAPIEDLWTVERLGGWDSIDTDIFGDSGVFSDALEAAQN